MNLPELLLIAVGLSMDAFAVSICKGLTVHKVKPAHIIITGSYFGCFQALMPLIGYFLGSRFSSLIEKADHWIAFALLALIGANMIYGALKSSDDDELDDSFGIKSMFPLAVATSIDALAVGVTFAFLEITNITLYMVIIGIVTFLFSAAGLKIGNVFGGRYKTKAEIIGGVILIIIGIKILLEHIGTAFM